MITILDLDNCIADDAWRIPHIDWTQQDPDRRYAKYHALCAFDAAANADLWADAPPRSCLIITARPESVRCQTEEWLRRAGVPVRDVLMRQTGDRRVSTELKAELMWRYMSRHALSAFDVAGAYDDRVDVVAMYRRYGLRAAVRAVHDICATTPPTFKELK